MTCTGKAFEGTGYEPTERLPVARELGETSVLFSVNHTMGCGEVEAIARR